MQATEPRPETKALIHLVDVCLQQLARLAAGQQQWQQVGRLDGGAPAIRARDGHCSQLLLLGEQVQLVQGIPHARFQWQVQLVGKQHLVRSEVDSPLQ